MQRKAYQAGAGGGSDAGADGWRGRGRGGGGGGSGGSSALADVHASGVLAVGVLWADLGWAHIVVCAGVALCIVQLLVNNS